VGARDAADVGRGFEDERAQAGFGEFKGGREPGWAGSDHEVGCLVRKRIQNLMTNWLKNNSG
jgi:hypothetical protein